MDNIEVYVPLAPAIEANETALAEGQQINKNTIRLEVLKTGAWNTNQGRFTLTANDLQEMAENFNNDVRPHSSTAGLPVDEEHDKKAALAWLKRPRVEANDKGGHTLVMDAELTGTGSRKVHDGTYKFFSPEVHFKHVDPEGKLPTLRNVLMGGGFTNRPLFKGLAGIPALTANDGTADEDNKIYLSEETQVDLNAIRSKDNKDVTTEERKLLDAAKDQLTDEERAKFYPEDAVTPPAPAPVTPPAPAAVAASEGTVSIEASELETLRANAAAGLEASEKLKRKEAEAEVTEMCFSEGNLKLPTDLKDEVTTLYLQANDEQKATIKKILAATTPMLTASDTSVQGTSAGDGQGDATSLLNDKATELAASDAFKGKGFSEALRAARQQYPDLAKEADAENDAHLNAGAVTR